MIFEGPDRRHNHDRIWLEFRLTAFNIEEFFGAKISAKPSFGNNIISEAKSRLSCDHRVTPMGNVGKWTSVNQRWIVLQRLDQIWTQCIF